MTNPSSLGSSSGQRACEERGFPLPALITLAFAGFITILTEALPAGLLPQIAADLSVSQSAAGQTVSTYALGSLITAIPLTRATQGVRRRRLLAITIMGFAFANLVTALSSSYALTMIARGIAGVSAGLLWALLAGYAARMVPDHQKGRAITVAMAGTPIALSIGVPAATYMGTVVGWRLCFAAMSAVAILLSIWVNTKLPDFPGRRPEVKSSIISMAAIPGVLPILFVTLSFVLAHNVLYTYITALLQPTAMETEVDSILLLLGGCALVGIWGVGIWIDRRLRFLAITSCLLFLSSCAILAWNPQSRSGLYMAVTLWGIAFGGAATIFQTALARAAGEYTDAAQSMLVTAWNLAIGGGGLLGGILLSHWSAAAFAPAVLALLAASLFVVLASGTSGFKSFE